ncbi:MAG TPA: FAD binding domain-containing protein [Tepidisphaeraceae bacterium]|jgi:xanthine dehydrogenase YagS FAD-binding subunit|nr:FAD binding domain-containing protein [Tepidisphaeraceae bacterium]
MQTFEWVDAKSVQQAANLLAETKPDRLVMAKAGGMDLLDLMKEGVIAPARLINLKTIDGLRDIKVDKDGLSLGALVTLHRIDNDPQIRQQYVALAEAAGHAATPQVRNAATIGGNLLQKPRCWYYRHDHFHNVEGDALERVKAGQNQYHAIFDNNETAMVQASTPATALVAYDAGVELTDGDGKTRSVKLTDFFLPPDMQRPVDAKIEPGEVLTRVLVPSLPAGAKAAYHKQTERESYDWPICDVAVVMVMDGDKVGSCSIVMGWVAPVPRHATAAEEMLVGHPITEDLARRAATAAVQGATPLSKNGYKVALLETVVRRTILKAAEMA